jgi:hypothetical protein
MPYNHWNWGNIYGKPWALAPNMGVTTYDFPTNPMTLLFLQIQGYAWEPNCHLGASGLNTSLTRDGYPKIRWCITMFPMNIAI